MNKYPWYEYISTIWINIHNKLKLTKLLRDVFQGFILNLLCKSLYTIKFSGVLVMALSSQHHVRSCLRSFWNDFCAWWSFNEYKIWFLWYNRSLILSLSFTTQRINQPPGRVILLYPENLWKTYHTSIVNLSPMKILPKIWEHIYMIV